MYPLLALCGVVLTWPLAVFLIPEQGAGELGALRLSGTVLAFGVMTGFLVALFRRPLDMFRVENILAFALFYWVLLDLVQAAYDMPRISREAIVVAFSASACFFVGLCLTWLLAAATLHPVGRNVKADIPIPPRFLILAIALCFFLGTARVTIPCAFSPACIVSGLLSPRDDAIWIKLSVGNFDTLLHHMRLFGFLVPILTVCLAHIDRRLSLRLLLAIGLSLLILVILLQSGGRRQIGMVAGAAGLVWLFLDRPVPRRKLLLVAIGVGALLLIMQAMVAWRYSGFFTSLSQGKELVHIDRTGIIVDTNFKMLSQITQLVPEQYEHTGWTGIYAVVAAPFPRSFLPNKPRHRGFDLAGILGMNVSQSYTWTCSAVGDLFLIGGFLACFLGGGLFGWLGFLVSRLLVRPPTMNNRMVYGLATMVLFLGMRALHDLVLFGVALLALWGIVQLRWLLLGGRPSRA